MDNIDKLVTLIKEGIISREALPEDFDKMVLAELGFTHGEE